MTRSGATSTPSGRDSARRSPRATREAPARTCSRPAFGDRALRGGIPAPAWKVGLADFHVDDRPARRFQRARGRLHFHHMERRDLGDARRQLARTPSKGVIRVAGKSAIVALLCTRWRPSRPPLQRSPRRALRRRRARCAPRPRDHLQVRGRRRHARLPGQALPAGQASSATSHGPAHRLGGAARMPPPSARTGRGQRRRRSPPPRQGQAGAEARKAAPRAAAAPPSASS